MALLGRVDQDNQTLSVVGSNLVLSNGSGADSEVPLSDLGGGTSSGLPLSQPSQPGFWLNNGALTFYDGAANSALDFNDGPVTDTFGVPLNIDI